MPGKLVIAIINLPAKQIGLEITETLVLGAADRQGAGTLLLTLDRLATIGSEMF